MNSENYFKSLIEIKNHQPVTTSLHVADVFRKNHADVMRKIKNLALQNCRTKNMFAKSTFVNRGRQYPMYYMNKDGFELLVMGFTGGEALNFKLSFIQAFNDMKNKLESLNPVTKYIHAPKSEALLLAAKQQKKIEDEQPKVDYYNKSMNNPGLMTATKIAKNYGFSATKLNRLLHKFGMIYWQGDSWTLYSKYQNMELGGYKTHNYDNNNRVSNLWKWNQKGKRVIYKLLAKHGIKPQAEQMSLLNWQLNNIRKQNEKKGNQHGKNLHASNH